MAEKRFEVVYSQGVTDVVRVLMDNLTGALYLQVQAGNAGGLTPLLDKNGKPMIWEAGQEFDF